LIHIVNKLADLDALEFAAAAMTKTETASAGLSGQRIVAGTVHPAQ
jgi:hypothetical protein